MNRISSSGSSIPSLFVMVLCSLLMIALMTTRATNLDNNNMWMLDDQLFSDSNAQYLDYHVSVELLEKKSEFCTNFVFPGKSLCNLVVTQTVKLNMHEQLKNVTKGRAYFVTPSFPIPHQAQSAEMIQVLHLNVTDRLYNESCPVLSEVTRTESNGIKTRAWKISFYEKQYPDPQVFQIKFKIVDVVKPLKKDKQNTFSLQMITESVLNATGRNGYFASVFVPYKDVDAKMTGFNYEPAPTAVYMHNGTHTLTYDNTGDKIAQNLTVSMTFPNHYYPQCQVIRWPSITMWAVVGGLTVVLLLYVIVHLVVEQILRARRNKEAAEYGRLD